MKTLAILGSHPRTRDKFDWREGVDVWSFNEAASNPINSKWLKRADAIFQMHIPAIWRNPNNRNDPKHYDWLKSQNEITVYMQDVYEDVPMSVKYPLEGIRDMLGKDNAHFLTSSVPQAMALAAYLDQYDRIEVYGVAMETNTEYGFQREGVAFWLGFLKGRGMDVYFADPTFEAPLYGYEGEVFIKYERFTNRIAELDPMRKEISGQYLAVKAQFDLTLDRFTREGQKAEQELNQAVKNLRTLAEQLGQIDGAIQENQRYLTKADEMLKVTEDFVFSRQEFESAAATKKIEADKAMMKLNSIGTTLSHLHVAVLRSAKGSTKHKKNLEFYRATLQEYFENVNMMGILRGVAIENHNYMTYLDRHIKAAGGSKSEEAILAQVQHA